MRAWRFRSRSSLLASSTLISVVSRPAVARRSSSRSICWPRSAKAASISLRPLVELLSLFLGFGQPREGRGVLGLGRLPLAVERRPLLVQLAAAFLGGGDGHAVFGQRAAAC